MDGEAAMLQGASLKELMLFIRKRGFAVLKNQ